MKKNTLKLIKIFTDNLFPKITFLLLVFITACTGGEDLVLDLDLNEFPSDTLLLNDVQIQTIKEDSQRTDNINFHVLGSIHDSVFGVSKANIYTQLSLGGSVSIPQNAEVDSVILKLAFVDYYGDLSANQSFSVYTLRDSINPDAYYYNTSSLALGKKVGFANATNVRKAGGFLKVDVTKLWGEKGLTVGSSYSKNEAFRKDMFGIAIISESDFTENQGLIYYFNMVSANSNVKAYYHYYNREGENLARINAVAELQFRTGAKTFSTFSHSYKNQLVETWLNVDSTNSFRGFVQALGGTYVSIKLPQLKDLADLPYLALHKVQLVLPCETSFHNKNFDPIAFLDIKKPDNDGVLFDLADKSKIYWNRAYSPKEKAYIFNITNHAQSILNNYKNNPNFVDNGLVIKAVKNEPIPFSAGRFVVKGSSDHRKDGAFLRIFFSKIDKP